MTVDTSVEKKVLGMVDGSVENWAGLLVMKMVGRKVGSLADSLAD